MLRLSGLIAILSPDLPLRLVNCRAQTGAIFFSGQPDHFSPGLPGRRWYAWRKSLFRLARLRIHDGWHPVQWSFSPACRQDTLSIYSYEFLFGKGNSGPYRLDAWVVKWHFFRCLPDNVGSGGSMNLWDPAGSWVLQPALFQIHGGHPGRNTVKCP